MTPDRFRCRWWIACNPLGVFVGVFGGLFTLACANRSQTTDDASNGGSTGGSNGGGSGGNTSATDDAGSPDSAFSVEPSDPTNQLFDPSHVVEVDVRMSNADWDSLRKQTRTYVQALADSNCLANPFPDPFTWFPAAVTVDGVQVSKALIRKKGFLGSLDEAKPALKIDFDDIVPGTRVYGSDDLSLSNSKQDPSYVRQCITYSVVRAAGLPAPRCNFAHVTVNGSDLGVYVNVERVDRDFLRRHFASSGGNLYEGTVSDFIQGWMGTFEAKTNELTADGSELRAVAAAATVDDAQLEQALGQVIALPAFYDFWATEVLIDHYDGYSRARNNYYVYVDPGTRLMHFIPWGTDKTMTPDRPAPVSVMAGSTLAWRLYENPATRAKYAEHLRALLDRAWDEPALLATIDRYERLIAPLADDRWGSRATATAETRRFVTERRTTLMAELASGPPAYDKPPRVSACYVKIGSARGTFTTTWGNGNPDPTFATGSGTLDITINGGAWQFSKIAATVGNDPETAGNAATNVIGLREDGATAGVVISVSQAQFVPGATVRLARNAAFATVVQMGRETGQFHIAGILLDGTVTFDQAAATNGKPVSGRFDATVYTWPYY